MSLSQIEKPLTLTAEGEKLVKESGFESIFETIKDELANRFSKEKAPKTKYDV